MEQPLTSPPHPVSLGPQNNTLWHALLPPHVSLTLTLLLPFPYHKILPVYLSIPVITRLLSRSTLKWASQDTWRPQPSPATSLFLALCVLSCYSAQHWFPPFRGVIPVRTHQCILCQNKGWGCLPTSYSTSQHHRMLANVIFRMLGNLTQCHALKCPSLANTYQGSSYPWLQSWAPDSYSALYDASINTSFRYIRKYNSSDYNNVSSCSQPFLRIAGG